MKPRFHRPRRRLRSELLSLIVVALVCLFLALAIPMDAIDFVPSADPHPLSASCAFISLSETEETNVLSMARSAWRVNSRDVKDLRIEMLADSPPERASSEVIPFANRLQSASRTEIPLYQPSAISETQAALNPQALPMDAEEPSQPPFSREDLLRLN